LLDLGEIVVQLRICSFCCTGYQFVMPGNDLPLLEKVFMGENKLNSEQYFDLNAHAGFFAVRWSCAGGNQCSIRNVLLFVLRWFSVYNV
jgi:hypothetical protein